MNIDYDAHQAFFQQSSTDQLLKAHMAQVNQSLLTARELLRKRRSIKFRKFLSFITFGVLK